MYLLCLSMLALACLLCMFVLTTEYVVCVTSMPCLECSHRHGDFCQNLGYRFIIKRSAALKPPYPLNSEPTPLVSASFVPLATTYS